MKTLRIIFWAVLALLILGWAIRVVVPSCQGNGEVVKHEAPSVKDLLKEAKEAANQEKTQSQVTETEESITNEKNSQSPVTGSREGILINAEDIPLHPNNHESMVPHGTLTKLVAVRVIDGDTLDASDGNRYRFYGVNTPEREGKKHDRYGTTQAREEECYNKATLRTKSLVEGKTIYVESSERPTGPNGRSLGYIYTANGLSVDQLLVQEGLARSWKKDGHHRDYLIMLEGEAQISMTGCLWKP